MSLPFSVNCLASVPDTSVQAVDKALSLLRMIELNERGSNSGFPPQAS